MASGNLPPTRFVTSQLTTDSMSAPAASAKKPRKKRIRRTVSQLRKQVDTNRQGQEGVAWVRWIVEGIWGCGLEVVSANNDDGVDAIILLKRRPALRMYAGTTGDLIFVQIKTGYRQVVPTGDYDLPLDAEKMAAWRMRWAAYPGPAIMINVIPRRLTQKPYPIAYWADLKDPGTDPLKVHFKAAHEFNANAKSDFYNLCLRWAEFRKLPAIRAEEDLPLLGKGSLRDVAKGVYKEIKQEVGKKPADYHAAVTWQGWEHITRLTRPARTQQQSLLLLPVMALMLRKQTKLEPIAVSRRERKTIGKQERYQWFTTLTARVTFFARHEAIVRVVLLNTEFRTNDQPTQTTATFYSIYEVARRKKSP